MFADIILHHSSQKQMLMMHHKCLNYSLYILLLLRENRNTPNTAIVQMSFDYMKRILNPAPEDFPFDPTTTLCLFDLLWNGLLTNAENLKYFVKIGSVYTLLDLIDVRVTIPPKKQQ